MRLKRIVLKILFVPLIFFILFLTTYIYLSLPLVTAFVTKALCSSVYLQHRNPDTIMREDLSSFPFSLVTYKVDESDSSVSANVFGLAEKKAIFRQQLGATLVNDSAEAVIRKQHFNIPIPLPLPDSVYWPLGNKPADSIPSNINKQQLDKILQEEAGGLPGKQTHTRAIVVIYNGELIAEHYAPGFSAITVMPAWSVTKSITGSLIGILVKQGKLNINTQADIPQWRGTAKQAITIQQLLQQTSGLDYAEKYLYPSEATNMLFSKGNMAVYVENLPLQHRPGTVFNYASGNTNILSDIIKRTVDEDAYASFPYKVLLHKIGMYSATLEPDASGMYVGSSYCYATARDFARFGLFCVNNGKWNNEQVLPENWITLSRAPAKADRLKRYGFHFWLNGLNESDSKKLQFPDVPADMYYADGYGGQYIFIIPSKQTVIVRLGIEKINENKLIADILSTLPSTKRGY